MRLEDVSTEGAGYSYKTLHKLIKSGMWKMYCSRDFQIVSVEWSDELRRMVGYQNEEDFPNSERVFSIEFIRMTGKE